MRISIDARPLSGPIDGISRYTEQIVRRLITHRDHQWLLYSDGPLRNHFLPAQVTVRAPQQRTLRTVATSYYQFARWAQQDQVDLFWTPRHHLPVGSMSAKALVTIHDLCWKYAPETMPIQRRLRESFLFSDSVKRASAVATVSKATLDQFATLYPSYRKKCRVISPGPTFEPTTVPEAKRPFLLAVGTVEPRKNYPLLLQTFSELAGSVPHDLVVVGRRGWGVSELPIDALATEVRTRVHWIHDADDTQLSRLYQQAALLISLARYEGFGLPLLESMRLGTPVFASNIAPHREVSAGAAVLHDLDSPNTIAAALRNLLMDPDQLSKLADAGRRRASDFSWDHAADELLTLMGSL